MKVPWTLVAMLAPLLARRVNASMDTAAAEAALLARDLQRRLVAALFAVAGVVLCLLLGAGWIAGIVWSTPWRNLALGLMLGGFGLCALGGAVLALRRRKPETSASGNVRAFPRSMTMRLLMDLTGEAKPSRTG